MFKTELFYSITTVRFCQGPEMRDSIGIGDEIRK